MASVSSSQFVFPAALLAALGLSGYLLLHRGPSILPKYIESPRILLPSLSEAELAKLPYTPRFYPGARWVKTPHGMTIVYEFGPEAGKKVLLIHGISTPSCVFRDLAWSLVEEGGCRVLLFDLYGRGYSDSPIGVRYDEKLYNTQILYALMSSSLPWLSPTESFSIIGYSLGGSLALAFVASLPEAQMACISSIVLLAPAGLLPSQKMSVFTKLGYRGYLPLALQTLVARRYMRRGVKEFSGDNSDRSERLNLEALAGWQASAHKGYLPAWMSTFKQCPIFDQQDLWLEIRSLMERNAFGACENHGQGRVMVVMGRKDETVVYDEVAPQIKATLQPHGDEEAEKEGWVKWNVLEDAEHDLVAKRGVEIGDIILEFWSLKRDSQGDRKEVKEEEENIVDGWNAG